MTIFTPGSLVHYRAYDTHLPIWPAVVCTDDVAPEHLVPSRPHGYVTLVLLMGNLEFHWALPAEMREYDPLIPFTDEETVERTPGLGDAYQMADDALERRLGIDYWRDRVTHLSDSEISEDMDASSDDEGESDRELKMAIRASRELYYGKSPRGRTIALPTPSCSPPLRVQKNRISRTSNETRTKNPFRPSTNFSATPSNPFRRSTDLSSTPSSSSEGYKRFPTSSTSLSNKFPFADRGAAVDVEKKHDDAHADYPKPLTSLHPRTLFDRLRNGSAASAPTSDVVEGELSESKEFVKVIVGEHGEVRMLQKQAVWDRPYFREPHLGSLNHFTLNDENTWELRHPRLADVEPEDFDFAAEYLESGDCGLKQPDGEEEVQMAFAQLVTAWLTAEKLGMTDLLEHICDKLERLAPWDMWNVMAFTRFVYRAEAPYLPAQERMMDLLATYIAEHYWFYLEDDRFSATLIQRLKKLPELELAIYNKRSTAVKERLRHDERYGEEENGEEIMDIG